MFRGDVGPPSGDRLELVEGAAGVPETTAGELRDGDPEGGDEGSERERDLVAHTARGVLVRRRLTEPREVQSLAGGDHRPGPPAGLLGGHPVEEDRHRQGGHLLVADATVGVRVDDPVDLGSAEFTSVPLGTDDVHCVECRCHVVLLVLSTDAGRGVTGIKSGKPLCGGPQPDYHNRMNKCQWKS